MPTNILRRRAKAPVAAPNKPDARVGEPRRVLITAGRVRLRARLLETPTAARIWAALPLFSTAETWGASIHFEVPIESGRERSARLNIRAGEICYWSEDDRVIIGFGPTPLSKPDEIRLPRPCNVWAIAIDDVGALAAVTPGERVSVSRAVA